MMNMVVIDDNTLMTKDNDMQNTHGDKQARTTKVDDKAQELMTWEVDDSIKKDDKE